MLSLFGRCLLRETLNERDLRARFQRIFSHVGSAKTQWNHRLDMIFFDCWGFWLLNGYRPCKEPQWGSIVAYSFHVDQWRCDAVHCPVVYVDQKAKCPNIHHRSSCVDGIVC